jgi:hypothetical protein
VRLLPYGSQRWGSVPSSTTRKIHVASLNRQSTVTTVPPDFKDVDNELWEVLDMATDSELEDIHDILYGTCDCLDSFILL